MWDNFKQPNIWVVEVLKGGDRNKKKTIQRNDSPKFSKLLIPVVKKKKKP